MRYTNLGRTGLIVSRVCLGMMSFGNDSERPWVLDEDAAEPIVKAAVDGGVTSSTPPTRTRRVRARWRRAGSSASS